MITFESSDSFENCLEEKIKRRRPEDAEDTGRPAGEVPDDSGVRAAFALVYCI